MPGARCLADGPGLQQQPQLHDVADRDAAARDVVTL
jgi:hypothetical protein